MSTSPAKFTKSWRKESIRDIKAHPWLLAGSIDHSERKYFFAKRWTWTQEKYNTMMPCLLDRGNQIFIYNFNTLLVRFSNKTFLFFFFFCSLDTKNWTSSAILMLWASLYILK